MSEVKAELGAEEVGLTDRQRQEVGEMLRKHVDSALAAARLEVFGDGPICLQGWNIIEEGPDYGDTPTDILRAALGVTK